MSMNPELQTLVDRIELLENEGRGWKAVALLGLILAVASIALLVFGRSRGAGPAPQATVTRARGSFDVVEANRFLLRDAGGKVAGGLEVDKEGTAKLVLGGRFGTRGAAFLQVHEGGAVDLTLRGADGGLRAALVASEAPTFSLTSDGKNPNVKLTAPPRDRASLELRDSSGRLRYRAR